MCRSCWGIFQSASDARPKGWIWCKVIYVCMVLLGEMQWATALLMETGSFGGSRSGRCGNSSGGILQRAETSGGPLAAAAWWNTTVHGSDNSVLPAPVPPKFVFYVFCLLVLHFLLVLPFFFMVLFLVFSFLACSFLYAFCFLLVFLILPLLSVLLLCYLSIAVRRLIPFSILSYKRI